MACGQTERLTAEMAASVDWFVLFLRLRRFDAAGGRWHLPKTRAELEPRVLSATDRLEEGYCRTEKTTAKVWT